MLTEAKLSRAQDLYREAQDHKRAANRLKRRARTKMELANKFRRELEAMGVTVVFEPSQPDHLSQGGTSDINSN